MDQSGPISPLRPLADYISGILLAGKLRLSLRQTFGADESPAPSDGRQPATLIGSLTRPHREGRAMPAQPLAMSSRSKAR